MMASILLSLLLVFLLLPFFTHAEVQFWNIDCGATEGFISTINLTWVGDDGYVRTGKNHQVANTTNVDTTLTTLRAFPKNKKNCYTFPVGTGVKVFVRVWFYYGNYDGLNNFPSFELLFEGNDWTDVGSGFEGVDEAISYSVVYVTKMENTSVCFGRTIADQDPFVSAIMLRTLEPEMYAEVNSSYALYRHRRYALGSNQSSIRFPYDDYDRIWYPIDELISISSYKNLTSNATVLSTSRSIDNPPLKVFQNAIAPSHGQRNLTLTTNILYSDPEPIYFNMYFTEIFDLVGSNGHKRSFHIYVDDQLISKEFGPIVPPYGNVLEFSNAALEATNSTRFTLVPTSDSTLPPIISGFEVMLISSFPNELTYPIDVDALSMLQNGFDVLQEWTGDPCLPQFYNWEWVACNSYPTPRITALLLGSYGLRGNLPDFSNLSALTIIDLHNNSLSGSVPEFLGKLPNLKQLNLADNNFDSIPASLTNNKKIQLNITGNAALTQRPSAPQPAAAAEAPPPISQSSETFMARAPAYIFYLLILVIVKAF